MFVMRLVQYCCAACALLLEILLPDKQPVAAGPAKGRSESCAPKDMLQLPCEGQS